MSGQSRCKPDTKPIHFRSVTSNSLFLWKLKTKSPSMRCTADWISIWVNNTLLINSKAWCGLGEKPAINQPQARKDGSHPPTSIHSSNTRTHRTRKKSIFRLSLCKNAILFIVFRILLAKVLTFAFFIYTFASPNEKNTALWDLIYNLYQHLSSPSEVWFCFFAESL